MLFEDCLDENKIKHETIINLNELRIFRAEHDTCSIEKSPLDPMGQYYNFRYTPSSCGTSVHIECGCGVKKDITDYSNW